MKFPSPPPLADALDALQHVMLPAAGASAFVFAAVLLLGRRWANLGAALAVGVGLLAGNWEKVPMPAVPTPSAWTHLPGYAFDLVLIGLLSQLATRDGGYSGVLFPTRKFLLGGKWLIRTATITVCANAVIPTDPGLDRAQFYALFVAGSVALWLALDGLADSGHPAEVSGLMGLTSLLGGGVMLYAHSAIFMDLATILGSALLGVAVVAGSTKVDARGAIPAFVGFFPGLLLSGRALTTSEVPAASFVLVALAPLTLLPWAIPNLSRRKGPWPRVTRMVSVLVPLVVALVLAGRVESLPWDEAW